MAINIFSGGASKPARGRNTASASTRAANAKAALARPAEVSSSGGTAVGTSGTLSKVGNFVGKAAGIASKFLPGVGGVVAKGIANLFNDPEWWQKVPGDAFTLNSPLRLISDGHDYQARVAIAEICSVRMTQIPEKYVIDVTDTMVTQYLIPNVRKVVNAVPLQDASRYATALRVNSTIYAVWRTLKKWQYLMQHGMTYIASMNDKMFPLFQVENSAQLQSAINRLEEHLRSHVRLPHTLCEYLAWRFGRIYKSNTSAKSALVMYDAIPMESTVTELWSLLETWMSTVSASPELQQANADLYNAYYDHDQAVEIRDDTQVKFDTKEFLLRTNMDHGASANENLNNVFLDSSLDNPTTFMASTVSTMGTDGQVLFPVRSYRFYTPQLVYSSGMTGVIRSEDGKYYRVMSGFPYLSLSAVEGNGDDVGKFMGYTKTVHGVAYHYPAVEAAWTLREGWMSPVDATTKAFIGSAWWTYHYEYGDESESNGENYFDLSGFEAGVTTPASGFGTIFIKLTRWNIVASRALFATMVFKAVDMYNKDLCLNATTMVEWADPGDALPWGQQPTINVDLTSLAMDMGQAPDATLSTEHLYAFANLVDNDRKTSMSYGKAEKLIARDTADLVEKLDIATPAT